MIKLEDIRRNPLNARRRFDGNDFDDFIESIRQQGILQPILVRPVIDNEHKYEIIFGERRFRAKNIIAGENAGKNAGKNDTIPALIRDLTNDESFELMTIENIQRKNLTELEEAENFKAWIDKKGPDSLPDLAARTGIDARYIRRRIAVLSLPKNILKAWDKGVILYGHLEQLMRIKDKKEIQKQFKSLFVWQNQVIPVKDLKRNIANQSPELSCAKFPLKKAGCHTCHQNTDVQKSLWNMEGSEKVKCLNPKCFKKHQNNHLLKNWKKTVHYKENKTTGFRFIEDLSYDQYEKFYYGKNPVKKCLECENFVTLIHLDGSESRAKVCMGPKSCFNSLGKKSEKGKSKKTNDGGPRVPWHGTFFREKFYEQALPMRINNTHKTSPVILRLALYSLVRTNQELHVWFAKFRGLADEKETGGYFVLSGDAIFREVSKMELPELHVAFKEASSHIIMGHKAGANERHTIASYLGIDLAAEFEMTEEYCQKKTVKELVDLGEKLGIFDDPKAEAFLFEKLLKKRKNFKACKKGELVRVFTESGVELKGRVPDEILNIDGKES